RRRCDEVVAVPLPAREAVREVDRVRVAEVVERLGREGRSRAALAVDDELARLVGDQRLDPRLEVVPRQVQRAGEMPLVPLVTRPDVDEERSVAAVAVEQRVSLRRRDLVDLGARGGQQLPIGRHYFHEYSGMHPARVEDGGRVVRPDGCGSSLGKAVSAGDPERVARGYRGAVSPFARVVAVTAAAAVAAV